MPLQGMSAKYMDPFYQGINQPTMLAHGQPPTNVGLIGSSPGAPQDGLRYELQANANFNPPPSPQRFRFGLPTDGANISANPGRPVTSVPGQVPGEPNVDGSSIPVQGRDDPPFTALMGHIQNMLHGLIGVGG